jgi:hypothetical protein
MVLLLAGAASRRIAVIRVGAALAVLGVIVNRLNIAIIAYRWYDPNHYVPTWQEVVVTLADNTITSSLTDFKVGVPYTFVITNTGDHDHNFNISEPISVTGSLAHARPFAVRG